MSQAIQDVAQVPERSGAAASKPVSGNTPLTEDQLRARLALNSPELVRALFEIAQRQIDAESARQGRLDAKANSLLTLVGLSLTVAFSFGATLIKEGAHFSPWILVPFGAAILFGLVAAGFALWAQRVMTYFTVNEETVFSSGSLAKGNDGPDAIKDDHDKRLFGLMEYQKALVPHLWDIANKHRTNHAKKARFVKYGQACFGGFLIALFLVCILLLAGLASPHTDAGSGTSAQESSRPATGTNPGQRGVAGPQGRGAREGPAQRSTAPPGSPSAGPAAASAR